MLAAASASSEADKFDAAFSRKGRTGLGFTSQSTHNNNTATSHRTQAERELLSSTSAFSASAYLQKFGWKSGTGLGKREDGIVSYVKASKREEGVGIGAGLAVQAIARSFETVYNNAARNFQVVIHADSSDDEDEAETEQKQNGETAEEMKDERIETKEEEEEGQRTEKERKKDRKRRRREEQQEEARQRSSDEDSFTSASASPPPAPTTAIRPSIAFKSASAISISTTASLSIPVVAPDSLLSFDPTRSHMYHDRCKGKLARLQAQEKMGQHIVEAIKRKRWEGMNEHRREEGCSAGRQARGPGDSGGR